MTCATSTLTHYIVLKNLDSTIYMGTYTTAEPSIGELRFIARLNAAALPLEYPFGTASTIAGGTAIEATDVYLVSGQTRSKFYSSQRFIDDKVHCVYRDSTTDPIHACMVLPDPAYEKSSGGPFHRDIDTNNVGDYTGCYFYMNSGHVTTDAYRQGFHGPYALAFSRSGVPAVSSFDTSFFADLGVTGYVAASSGRGYVAGTATGVDAAFRKVLHWYNADYQYWVYASTADGKFTSPAMVPGAYTMVLYQEELVVATTTVSVKAGSTTSKSLAAATQTRTTLWQIGLWDGMPTGFRNAANQLRMHPSDSRMSGWGPLTYTVGTSALTDVPMALFKGVNDPFTIKFTGSTTAAATLRIGTTLAFSNGRPQATINSFTGPVPASPVKIDSRGVTRGAYRGYGEVYDVAIPAGTLVKGSNTITISVVSGNTGDDFLSPNFVSIPSLPKIRLRLSCADVDRFLMRLSCSNELTIVCVCDFSVPPGERECFDLKLLQFCILPHQVICSHPSFSQPCQYLLSNFIVLQCRLALRHISSRARVEYVTMSR